MLLLFVILFLVVYRSPGSTGSKKLDEKALAKKKPKKRKKLPKRYDPKVTPDPERWLPRRERSTYLPKKQRTVLGLYTTHSIHLMGITICKSN